MARKEYAGGAASAKLTAGISNAPSTVAIDTAAGWPVGTYPFVAVIDRGVAGKEEKKRFSARSGTTLTVDTGGNGVDGTAAVAHDSGATIEHALDAESLTDFARHVYDTTSDDHTQYLNNARHDVTARHTFGAALGTPGTPADVGTTAAAGSGTVPARSDHVHILAAGVAGDGLSLTAGVLAVVVGSGLEIVADAVRVAAALAGDGLTGGGGSPLAVNAGTGLEIVTDAVRIAAAAAGNGLTGGGGSPLAVGASSPFAVSADAIAFATGYRPTFAGSSAPSSPVDGDLWFDTTNSLWKFYNGTAWTSLTPVTAGPDDTGGSINSGAYGNHSGAVGPAVTLDTGTAVWVELFIEATNNSWALDGCRASFAVSGATTLAAHDLRSVGQDFNNNTSFCTYGGRMRLTGLTAGSNTFTMKYRSGGAGDGAFFYRNTITVTPIPS